VSFEVVLGAARGPMHRTPLRDGAMRVLVLGDFTGRGNRGAVSASDLGERPVLPLDLDAFDATFRRLAPSLVLGAEAPNGESWTIRFEGLEDFHPDHLYAKLGPLRALRESRSRLLDPASFEREAASLVLGPAAGASEGSGTHDVDPLTPEREPDLLQRLIGGAPGNTARPTTAGGIDALIRRLVEPHVTTVSSRSPKPYLDALDASLGELMRAVLHHRDVQALESNWRGVRRFVDGVELGESVTLHVADVAKQELLEDLAACGGTPSASALGSLLAAAGQRGADAAPWSLIVGLFDFGATDEDLSLLAHLGAIVAQAGAPLLAAARPDLVGCRRIDAETDPREWRHDDPESARRWQDLRRSPVARWLGLALPRILLRQPYGAKSDPVEAFGFEELAAGADHEAYLWGNPGLACAQGIAAAHVEAGAEAATGGPFDISDLPLCLEDEHGERRLKPCAEYPLSVGVGEELLRRGAIPLLSYGNRNAARILAVRSIADPPAALAGFG
jgi:type VI secretion system protein ImpC